MYKYPSILFHLIINDMSKHADDNPHWCNGLLSMGKIGHPGANAPKIQRVLANREGFIYQCGALPFRVGIVTALFALAGCSAPQLEEPPPSPTPLFEMASDRVGEESNEAEGFAENEALEPSAPQVTEGEKARCNQASGAQSITLSVGQTQTIDTGLHVTFEGEVNTGESEAIASISFALGHENKSWVPSPGESQQYTEILGYCVRVAQHSEGTLILELVRP